MKDNRTAKLILDKLFEDVGDTLTKAEAMEKVNYILTLMTKKQRVDMHKKVERCLYYIDAIQNKGMDKSRVRSILTRKYDIQRQHMNGVCKPCDEIMNKNNF